MTPDAGTDVRAISTVATRDRDGWILNGGKKWIGLAPYAAFNVVLAKLDHDGRDAETVALVIDLESDGISRSGPLDLMSFRGMPLGELTFNDVKVPAGSALKVAGFKGMMEGINLARVDAASYGCGFIKAAIRECSVRANNRTAFGQPLSNVQVIQTKIGLMATDYEAARLLTLAASDSFALGHGGDPILLSKAKLFSTDAAMRHAVEAVQIFGALGRPPQQPRATTVPGQQGPPNLRRDQRNPHPDDWTRRAQRPSLIPSNQTRAFLAQDGGIRCDPASSRNLLDRRPTLIGAYVEKRTELSPAASGLGAPQFLPWLSPTITENCHVCPSQPPHFVGRPGCHAHPRTGGLR